MLTVLLLVARLPPRRFESRAIANASSMGRLSMPPRSTEILNTMDRFVVEKPCTARTALMVAEPVDHKSIAEAAGLHCASHIDIAAIRTWQRLRDRCFSWMK